jgi:hypothetical protein
MDISLEAINQEVGNLVERMFSSGVESAPSVSLKRSACAWRMLCIATTSVQQPDVAVTVGELSKIVNHNDELQEFSARLSEFLVHFEASTLAAPTVELRHLCEVLGWWLDEQRTVVLGILYDLKLPRLNRDESHVERSAVVSLLEQIASRADRKLKITRRVLDMVEHTCQHVPQDSVAVLKAYEDMV